VRGVRFDRSPVRDIDGINDNGAQRGLATIHKIYPREKKYGGAKDVLDVKLRIFNDLCPKAGIGLSE
jgi:hypothetical protein